MNALRTVRNIVATRAQVSQPVLTAKVLSRLTGGSSSLKHGPQFDRASSAIAQANTVAGPLNFPSAAEVDRTSGILAARRAAAPASPGAPAITRIPFDEVNEAEEPAAGNGAP